MHAGTSATNSPLTESIVPRRAVSKKMDESKKESLAVHQEKTKKKRLNERKPLPKRVRISAVISLN